MEATAVRKSIVLIIFCIVSTAIYHISGALHCLQCTDVTYEGVSDVARDLVAGWSSDSCLKKENISEIYPDIDLVMCPGAKPDMVYKCGFMYGTVAGNLRGSLPSDNRLTIHARGCLEVDSSTPDGCRDGLNTVEEFTLIASLIKWAGRLRFDKFEGKTCFCSKTGCVSVADKIFSKNIFLIFPVFATCVFRLF